MPLEHALHDVEVPPHDATQELGVEPLPERGRLREVDEEDGDDLARLGRDAGAHEVRAAPGTEPCGRVVFATAGRAGHTRELARLPGSVADAKERDVARDAR